MESQLCVHCSKTTGGELLCGECYQLRSGERGFSCGTGSADGDAGQRLQALVCLVQQAEGHSAVRLFEKPVQGAGTVIVGEVPTGTLVRCSDREPRMPFFRVQWQELDGWVGIKNVSWIQSQISQSEGDAAAVPETPLEPAPAMPPAQGRKAAGASDWWGWRNVFCGSAASVDRESPNHSTRHDATSSSAPSTPSARVRATQHLDFNLGLVNSKPVVPSSPVDPRDQTLVREAERMTNHCTFRQLTVLAPAELFDGGRASKEDTLELYSPYASVPAQVKQAVVAEVRRLAGSPASRAVGALVGMAVADATGAPFEFMSARNKPCRSNMIDPHTLDISGKPFNKFHLKPGQWSDDTAMGLCLADSLLENQGYNGSDVRVKFHNWWFRGYNNAFGNDRRIGSVGLGGNVSKSLAAMVAGRIPPPRYEAPNEDAGNGSLMRLAAVPVLYARSPVKAAEVSAESSRSTHPGHIAAAACAFLGFAISKAIVRDSASTTAQEFLDGVVSEFLDADMPGAGECAELRRLLQSREPRGREECWNWRDSQLQIESSLQARGRSYNGYPCTAGYFGSYCIDGLAIALWGFYSTSTFHEAVVRCVNCLGDADTTAAICGQLAGAFYGYEAVPERWLRRLEKWDDQDIVCRAVLLHVAAQADDPGASEC